ncbi:MAG: DUF4136 domain-containing protein [Flavobacteriaceae bacterium]|nr:DUF4136 domain-containing protein [Flavobacteriaceae bacterium]
MKRLKLCALVLALTLFSCTSVRVASDYDKEADFGTYKTFAFYKPGIDKVKISDIDKKRIHRAIEAELLAKGMSKSQNPDVMVNIFTKARRDINVYQDAGFGWGYGWGPWYGGYYQSIQKDVTGTMYIDLIDAKDKQLVWQGKGSGYLTDNPNKKEERIREFVAKIMQRYPPGN